MQEDINHRTVALVIRTGKLTADVLRVAMREYLNHQRQKKMNKEPKHGKMSVRKLMGKDQGAQTLEIKEDNIKSFERVAKKYNIDFAVKKDRTEAIAKYVVFFKGRDSDVITRAFKEYVDMNEKNKDKPSLKAQLTNLIDLVNQNKKRQMVRQKQKVRQKSL